jgi:caffeoyl-CoA O-methyltransferase
MKPMQNTFETLAQYIESSSTVEDDLLNSINRQTHLKVLNPRMLSGPVLGKFLEFISFMSRPENILEIGTYTGYSAICLARGLNEKGRLVTIERNDELKDMILTNFERSGLQNRIDLRIGNALEIIPLLDAEFDLIFIDADKTEYLEYYTLAIDKLRKGGFILVDNVLWDGKVISDNSEPETLSIRAFNEFVKKDGRVENIILSLRDGINLIRKI